MSPTLGREMLYAAVLAPARGLVVRVAMPMSRVKGVQNEVMRLASVFLYVAPFVCAIISFFCCPGLGGQRSLQAGRKTHPVLTQRPVRR